MSLQENINFFNDNYFYEDFIIYIKDEKILNDNYKNFKKYYDNKYIDLLINYISLYKNSKNSDNSNKSDTYVLNNINNINKIFLNNLKKDILDVQFTNKLNNNYNLNDLSNEENFKDYKKIIILNNKDVNPLFKFFYLNNYSKIINLLDTEILKIKFMIFIDTFFNNMIDKKNTNFYNNTNIKTNLGLFIKFFNNNYKLLSNTIFDNKNDVYNNIKKMNNYEIEKININTKKQTNYIGDFWNAIKNIPIPS